MNILFSTYTPVTFGAKNDDARKQAKDEVMGPTRARQGRAPTVDENRRIGERAEEIRKEQS